MFNLNSVADLQNIIRDKISESNVLEYKERFVLNTEDMPSSKNKKRMMELAEVDKKEFAKDLSAMANSNGGTIIYGIAERKNELGRKVPIELKPIKINEMDKERLARLIMALITPKIDFEITYIPDDKEDGGYFVVDIAKSDTAHQNIVDKCYYNRKDTISTKMEDYEIRDVMNRGKDPKVDLKFCVIRTKVYPNDFNFDNKENKSEERKKLDEEGGYTYRLTYRLVNEGKVMARYVNYFIYIPNTIIEKGSHFVEEGLVVISGNNKTDSSLFVEAKKNPHGEVFEPLLPGMKSKEESLSLELFGEEIDEQLYIEYEVHADNSNYKRKRILLSSLECINTEGVNWKDLENNPEIQKAFK